MQGVGFRFFVEREAHMLGIAGWVRNNPDGTVEVLAMGNARSSFWGLRGRLWGRAAGGARRRRR